MLKRRKTVAAPEDPVVATGNPKKTSIIFENGPASNDDLTNEFHLLPCRIEYDGPAQVSQYFVTEKLEDDKKVASFRGRILSGAQQQFPEGYRLYIASEKESKNNSRIFEVIGSATSFMRWEYDRNTSYQSPLVRAISYLSTAEAFTKNND